MLWKQLQPFPCSRETTSVRVDELLSDLFFHNLSDLICFRNGTVMFCLRCRQKILKRQDPPHLW